MSEAAANYTELKKEVIETRNQAIKTDNQIKNLVLDVKGFEKRFELWEKRSRFSALGVHILVALAVWAAAHVFYTAKTPLPLPRLFLVWPLFHQSPNPHHSCCGLGNSCFVGG